MKVFSKRQIDLTKSISVERVVSRLLGEGLNWAKVKWLVMVAAMLVLMPFAAKAQIGATGTIQGTVTDPTGAVIPGALVMVTNKATGAVNQQKTTKDGFYSVAALPIGQYSLSVTARGFKKLVHGNITLNGMQVLGLNLTMAVGAATQTVTVSTEPPPLETQDATLGASLAGTEYKQLPLEMGAQASPDQQRVTDFAALMPGVSIQTNHGNLTDAAMVVNGQNNATATYVEGVPFTFADSPGDPRFIWPALGVQSVSQFQLKTSSFSAEYTGLDVENFNTNSGTNQIHGSVYDIVRNTAFDAFGFLPPHNNVTGNVYKPPEHMNEYGLDAGFPLVKNKLFFFGAFEGYRFSTVVPETYNTLPTKAEFQGDFSQLLNQEGIQIYDPLTETCSTTSCTRQPFPGNIIPPGEISPVAQALSQFWGKINYANDSLTNNFLGTYGYGLSNWDGTVRIDYHPSDRQTITGILATGRQGLVGPSATTTNMGPFPYRTAKYYRPITHLAVIEDTYTISSTLVNQFKYGAAQYHSPDFNPTYGFPGTDKWAASNWIGGLPSGQAAGGFSEEKFSGSFSPAQWGVDGYNIHNENNFNLVDSLQWVHGKHSLSFGGQIRWFQDDVVGQVGGSGPLTLNLNSSDTAQFEPNSLTLNSKTGNSFASFMLGAVDSASYSYVAPIATAVGSRYRDLGFYVNDDIRATPNLTVNAGLRWDFMPPFHETENRWSFMNPALSNPITGTPGALEYVGNIPGVGCDCQTPVRSYFENFGPRLGIAWALNNKTVLRASYGIYYTAAGPVNAGPNSTPPGFGATVSASSQGYSLPAFYLNGNADATSGANYDGGTVQGLSNDPENTTFGGGQPGTGIPTLPIYSAAFQTYYSTNPNPYQVKAGVPYYDPYLGDRAPQFEGWTFGFQRLLTPNITATVSWVGNEAHFIAVSGARGLYSNGLDPKYLYLGSTLGEKATPSNTPGGVPYSSFVGSTGSVEQALLPYPQYSGVSDVNESVGNTSYNALQLSIRQRAVHGLTYTLNYTWSKTMDDIDNFRSGYAIPAGVVYGSTEEIPQNSMAHSLSRIDIPQNLKIYGVYQLPFGKGQLGGSNLVARSIVGGWALSAIFEHIAGNPLEITSKNCSAPGQGTCFPIYTPNFTGSARQNGGWGHGATAATLGQIQYVNPDAFETTTQLSNQYVIGNIARSAPDGLFAPGHDNWEGGLRRTFNLMPSERVKLVFEANVFNATNNVLFGSTSSNYTSKIGQQVNSSGSKSLGVVTGQANQPRQWQFEGHITF